MNKISENEKGFTIVEGLLLVFILAAIGFGGYYIWHTQHTKKTSSATTVNTNIKAVTPSSNSYSGWETYTLPAEKLSFMYPPDWTMSTSGSTSTQDSINFTNSDGSTFWIEDGVSNGGGSTPEAPAIPITFMGQTVYLVPVYGCQEHNNDPDSNTCPSSGLISGAALQTSTKELAGANGAYPLPKDKHAVGPSSSNGTGKAMFFWIGCNLITQVNLQQFSTNSFIENVELVIDSIHY